MSQESARAAAFSVLSNTLLVAGKLAVGLTSGSVSIVSEAIHSAVDLLASLIAWFAVRTASRPADRDHPFGHGKIENLSATVEALLIIAAGVWIILEAVERLRHPAPLAHAALGAAVMAISTVVNWLVSRHLFRVGARTGSVALTADAWHLRTDVWTSLGVMTALAAVAAGHRWLPQADLTWIDPVAAIAVALLILHAGWTLTRQAGRDLLDAALPAQELAALHDATLAADPRIAAVAALRARRSGAQRQVEVTIILPATLAVGAAHAIADRVEAAIASALPGTRSSVHVEPGTE